MTGHILKALSSREMEHGPTATSDGNRWDHWTLARGDDDIAWLSLDMKDRGANTISTAVLTELDEILGVLEQRPPKGMMIRSTKSSGFCMGADIHEFSQLTSEGDVRERLGQHMKW